MTASVTSSWDVYAGTEVPGEELQESGTWMETLATRLIEPGKIACKWGTQVKNRHTRKGELGEGQEFLGDKRWKGYEQVCTNGY